MPTRSLYRRLLAAETPAAVTAARNPSVADREGLARLMLDAYVGTIDYEGETIDEARMAIDDYLSDDPLLDCSFVVEADTGSLQAAMLVSLWSDGQPLVSYAITDPTFKSTGLATALLAQTLGAMRRSGHAHVHAAITDGNTPSERLFTRAGFEVVETFDN